MRGEYYDRHFFYQFYPYIQLKTLPPVLKDQFAQGDAWSLGYNVDM